MASYFGVAALIKRNATPRRIEEARQAEKIKQVVERRQVIENGLSALELEAAQAEVDRNYGKFAALKAKYAKEARLAKQPVRALWAEQERLFNQSSELERVN